MQKSKCNEKCKNIKTNLLRKFVLIFVVLIFPIITNAQIIITEIMYDLEGSDKGREWIEIYNNGNDSVDLTNWKLVENDKNHNISLIDGETDNFLIPSNSYAVFVVNKNDIDNFYNDNLNFSGILFYSAFISLNNTSLTITLKDSDEIKIDFVPYNSEQGANGNGNSLQLVDNEWKESIPTPGLPNIFENQQSQTETQEDNSSQTQEIVILPKLIEQNIFANAGGDRKVIAGADTQYKGLVLGLKGEPIQNARFSWSFGDGSIQDGQNILHSYLCCFYQLEFGRSYLI